MHVLGSCRLENRAETYITTTQSLSTNSSSNLQFLDNNRLLDFFHHCHYGLCRLIICSRLSKLHRRNKLLQNCVVSRGFDLLSPCPLLPLPHAVLTKPLFLRNKYHFPLNHRVMAMLMPSTIAPIAENNHIPKRTVAPQTILTERILTRLLRRISRYRFLPLHGSRCRSGSARRAGGARR